MENKAKLTIALFLCLLAISSGCVNRYQDCDQNHMGPGDPQYSCCLRPGEVSPDPSHPARTCCPGTTPMKLGSETADHCHLALEGYWSSWQSIAVLAVLISAFLVSLAYMLGHIISSQMLIMWAKNELFQVLASAFLLGALIGLVFMMQQALASEISSASGGGITCIGNNCHIMVANQYLEVMYNDASTMARGIVRVNSAILFFRNLYVSAELLVSPYYGAIMYPLAGLGIPSESLKNTLDVLIKVMMLLKAQQIALNLIAFSLFPTLLVMGLVFRTFFFTRKLGGLLIAIAIGLYLIYPLVFILAHNIWLSSIYKDRSLSLSHDTNIGSYIVKSDIGGNLVQLLYPTLGPGESNIDRLLKVRSMTSGLTDSLGGIVTGEWLIGDGGYIEKTSLLLVYATLIPFIALMTTIGFVRGLSIILGGDMEIAGLTHLI